MATGSAGNLFSKLARSGVRAVALDLLYTEPDNYPANDLSLANAIGRLPLAVLPVLTEGRNPYAEYAEKLPIPGITQHADNIGHISHRSTVMTGSAGASQIPVFVPHTGPCWDWPSQKCWMPLPKICRVAACP